MAKMIFPELQASAEGEAYECDTPAVQNMGGPHTPRVQSDVKMQQAGKTQRKNRRSKQNHDTNERPRYLDQGTKKVPYSIRLNSQTLDRVREMAYRDKVTAATVIHTAVVKFLDEYGD